MSNIPRSRKKRYSLEQANRTLPLVRLIVDDIVKGHRLFAESRKRFAVLQRQKDLTEQQEGERDRLEDEIRTTVSSMEGFVKELDELGIQVKGLEDGLIDFPSERDGREVFLCWKLGEESIGHWHEAEAGYAGRQPIDHEESFTSSSS